MLSTFHRTVARFYLLLVTSEYLDRLSWHFEPCFISDVLNPFRVFAHDYESFKKRLPGLSSVRMTGDWQWATVGTVGTSTWPNLEASGCYTWTIFTGDGGKVWYALRSQKLTCGKASGLQDFDPNDPKKATDSVWESIYLMPGDYLWVVSLHVYDLSGHGD
jgi:hypothetical protein